MFWIPLALSAAQGLNSGSAKRNAYKDARSAQKHFDKLNLQFTNADLMAGYAALAERRTQESRAMAISIDQITRDVEGRIATASVSAAEAGVKGPSVDAVLNDFKRIQLENEQNILETEEFSNSQFINQVESLRSQAHSRLIQGMMPNPQVPNYMQEFVNFATTALQAHQYEREFNAKYDKTGTGGKYDYKKIDNVINTI